MMRFLIIFFLIFFPVSCSNTNNPSTGDNARVYCAGIDIVPVSISEDAYNKYIKAKVANDVDGIKDLISVGQLMIVDNNTKVLIVDVTWTLRKIRILEGIEKGKAGWVPYEWVKPL